MQEKLLKQKAKDEKAKAILLDTGEARPSPGAVDDLLSELRTEADKAHTDVLESLELVLKSMLSEHYFLF